MSPHGITGPQTKFTKLREYVSIGQTLVSDIAIFVLKRDVKLQPTNRLARPPKLPNFVTL